MSPWTTFPFASTEETFQSAGFAVMTLVISLGLLPALSARRTVVSLAGKFAEEERQHPGDVFMGQLCEPTLVYYSGVDFADEGAPCRARIAGFRGVEQLVL